MNKYRIIETLERIQDKDITLSETDNTILKEVIDNLKQQKPFKKEYEQNIKDILSQSGIYKKQEIIDEFMEELHYKNIPTNGINVLGVLQRFQDNYKDSEDNKLKLSEEEKEILAKIIDDIENKRPFNKKYKNTIEKIIYSNEIFKDTENKENFLASLYTNSYIPSSSEDEELTNGPNTPGNQGEDNSITETSDQGRTDNPRGQEPEGPTNQQHTSLKDKLEYIRDTLNRGIPAENTTYNRIISILVKNGELSPKDKKTAELIINNWSDVANKRHAKAEALNNSSTPTNQGQNQEQTEEPTPETPTEEPTQTEIQEEEQTQTEIQEEEPILTEIPEVDIDNNNLAEPAPVENIKPAKNTNIFKRFIQRLFKYHNNRQNEEEDIEEELEEIEEENSNEQHIGRRAS